MSLWARTLNAMYRDTEYTVADIAVAIHRDQRTAAMVLEEMKKSGMVVRTHEGKYKRLPKEAKP